VALDSTTILILIGVPVAIILGIISAVLIGLVIYFYYTKVYMKKKGLAIPVKLLTQESSINAKEVLIEDGKRDIAQRAYAELDYLVRNSGREQSVKESKSEFEVLDEPERRDDIQGHDDSKPYSRPITPIDKPGTSDTDKSKTGWAE
jgi:hypothetical protein